MVQIFREASNFGAEKDFKDWIVQSAVWYLIESFSHGLVKWLFTFFTLSGGLITYGGNIVINWWHWILNIHPRSTLATWCDKLTHWKRSCTGKDWRQEERGGRRMRGWMVSPTQWTWICVSSRRWWRTENTGMLQSMGLRRVRHNWATEQ